MARSKEVDARIPRAKAWFHAFIPALAFLAGPPWAAYILAITSLLMALSVVGGLRLSAFGQLYVRAIKPLVGIAEGKREAAAPHRFAEAVGAIFLAGAAVSYLWGAIMAGQILTLVVVGLAVLNGAAGICVGCQMYLLLKRLQGEPA